MKPPILLSGLLPRRFTARWQRTRLSVAALAMLGLAACATDQPSDILTPSASGPAGVALRAIVPRTDVSAGPAQVRISVSYLRVTGAPVPLGAPQLFTLGLETQKVPVSVDVATCVADPTRAGASGGVATGDECQLQIELEFLLNAVRVDRQVLNNVSVRPGQTATVSEPVALALVSDVKIVVPTANQQGTGARAERGQSISLGVQVIDSDGKTVTGRAVRWRSSDPSVATIDANGLVSAIATGSSSLTAEVAGREVSTSLTVLLPSRTITVSADGASGAGVVQSSPAGITCSVQAGVASGTCSFRFPGEAVVSLGATAASGSTFGAFAGDCLVTASGACTVTDGSTSRAIRASFIALRALTVSTSGDGDGVVRSATAPINCRGTAGAASGTCSAQLVDGATVALEAVPEAGSVFLGWSGDCSNAAGCSLVLSAPRAVTARFARLRTVSVVAGSGSGRGTITSQPAGLNCTVVQGTTSGTCTTAVASGTVITLSANPDGNNVFAGWSGACTGTGSCVVTVTQATSVTASFLGRRTLSVSGSGDGAGRVSSSGSIACEIDAGASRGVCEEQYTDGATAQLSAIPATGSAFVGWTGGCSGTGSCSVLMSGSRTVTAQFARMKRVTVSARPGTGFGTVTSEPAGIVCTVSNGSASGSCSALFAAGTSLRLSAAPATSSTFQGWGGACSGTSVCAVTVTDDASVQAGFGGAQLVTVSAAGTGRGTVTSLPAGINCTINGTLTTGSCSALLGGQVTLTASGTGGSSFNGWGGRCSGTGSCSFSPVEATTIVANFARPVYTLTVSVAGTLGGVSSSLGACSMQATNTGVSCSYRVPEGQIVFLSPSPASGQAFAGWTGACTGTGSCSLLMEGDRTVGALFVSERITVNLSGSGTGVVLLGGGGRCTITAGSSSGTCSTGVLRGQSITLSIDPTASFPFLGWGGACAASGTALSCTLTPTGNSVDVSVRFANPSVRD